MTNFSDYQYVMRWTAQLAVAATLLGCSPTQEGPSRVAVQGEVTFRGKPLEKGSILFIPIGETKGPRAGAVIESGEYRLSRDQGPIVGRLRVEIRGHKELGYDITEPAESVKHIGEPMLPEMIPPEFNEQSRLVVETTSSGDNSFDFRLPTKP